MRFREGATHLLSGPSGSGKTFTITQILQNKEIIFVAGDRIKNVVFCYASWQPSYDKLTQEGLVTRWVNKMPTNEEFVSLVEPFKHEGGSIVVINDFMSEIGKDFVDIVTVSARHNKASTFILFQSLFPTARLARQISLNVKYMWIFKNPRENAQFGYLIRQIRPQDDKWLHEAYEEATSEPYTYMLLGLTQECPDRLRFRACVLPNQWPMKIYTRKGAL